MTDRTIDHVDEDAAAVDSPATVTGAEPAGVSIGDATAPVAGLWSGDMGILGDASRRALVQLIKGPYVSGERHPGVWSALRTDQRAIESRLHELFLELVIDPIAEFAFVRNVSAADFAAPSTVRTQTLTFLDSAMLLVLRELLLTRESDGRVIVGRDEVFDRLSVYRSADRDESDFEKRLNASWTKMRDRMRIVHRVGRASDPEDRVEISPVLRLIVDAAQVRAVAAECARIAGTGVETGETLASSAADRIAEDQFDDDPDEDEAE